MTSRLLALWETSSNVDPLTLHLRHRGHWISWYDCHPLPFVRFDLYFSIGLPGAADHALEWHYRTALGYSLICDTKRHR